MPFEKPANNTLKNKITKSVLIGSVGLSAGFLDCKNVSSFETKKLLEPHKTEQTQQGLNQPKLTQNPLESFGYSFAKTREYHINHVHKELLGKNSKEAILHLSSSLFLPWNSFSPLWTKEHFQKEEQEKSENSNNPAIILGNILGKIESVPEVFIREELLEVACMYLLMILSGVLTNDSIRKLITGGGLVQNVVFAGVDLACLPIKVLGEIQASFHKNQIFPNLEKHKHHFPIMINSLKALECIDELTPETRAKVLEYWLEIRSFIKKHQSLTQNINPLLSEHEKQITKIIRASKVLKSKQEEPSKEWYKEWAKIEPIVRQLQDKPQWQNLIATTQKLPKTTNLGIESINQPEIQNIMNPSNYDLNTQQGKSDFLNNSMIMRILMVNLVSTKQLL
jgi:hypothetical protein